MSEDEIIIELKEICAYLPEGKNCKSCKHFGGISFDEKDTDAYKCLRNPSFKFRVNEQAVCDSHRFEA